MQTIDMTPSWETQVHMCLMIINGSANIDAIGTAKEELLRMGRILDQMQASAREAEAIQQDIEFQKGVD